MHIDSFGRLHLGQVTLGPTTYRIGVDGGYITNADLGVNGFKWVSQAGALQADIFRQTSTGRLYVTNNGTSNLTGVYLDVGATSWTSTSDGRLKQNVKNTTYGLDTVLSIPVREYSFRNSESNRRRIGFIAQEIYPIIPEIVSKGDDGEYTESSRTWGIDYAGLSPVLVKAIQELNQQIESLKSENAELKRQSELILNQQKQIDLLVKLACRHNPEEEICK
jgi:hypothetical protein